MPATPNQVVLAAVCECGEGSSPTTLIASIAPTLVIMGRVAATIADVEFAGKFGHCGILNKPCDYSPGGEWSTEVATITFGGLHPLVKGAKLPCTHRGEITVVEVGQTTLGAGQPDKRQLQAYAEASLSDNKCIEQPYKDPNFRFDATYEANDGTVVILNNVTQAELEEYKKRDDVNTMNEEVDAFLADPFGYLLSEGVSGVAKGAGRTLEERARLQRTGIPVTRGR